jgi:HSP20 family protein
MNGIVPRSFFSMPSLLTDWEDMEDQTRPFSSSGLAISEDEKHVYVEAPVPGVNPKDIDITFDKGVLWIKAESKESEEDKKRKVYSRTQRSFSYRVSVPGEIDSSMEPEASYERGVMRVAFAKSSKAQPKKIALKSVKE